MPQRIQKRNSFGIRILFSATRHISMVS